MQEHDRDDTFMAVVPYFYTGSSKIKELVQIHFNPLVPDSTKSSHILNKPAAAFSCRFV